MSLWDFAREHANTYNNDLSKDAYFKSHDENKAYQRLNHGLSPTTFEVLACSSLRSSSIIFTHVVIYQPGSEQVTDRILRRNYHAPRICCYLSKSRSHLRRPKRPTRTSLAQDSGLHRHSIQNIKGSTHKGGHTLDLVITRRNTPLTGYRVDPPVYSNHGLVHHPVSTKSLLTGSTANSHLTKIHWWVAPIHPHLVFCLHAARHAARVTKGGHCQTDPQEV